jgi:hypothetical protein
MVCVDDSVWYLKACLCSSHVAFLVIFEAFFEEFLLDVMNEDLVPLCLVILLNKHSKTASIWWFSEESLGRCS